MKLAKTINIILLPVLLLVFAILGTTMYSVFDMYFIDMIEQRASYIAASVAHEGEESIEQAGDLGEQIMDRHNDGDFASVEALYEYLEEEMLEEENSDLVGVRFSSGNGITSSYVTDKYTLMDMDELKKHPARQEIYSDETIEYLHLSRCESGLLSFCAAYGSEMENADGSSAFVQIMTVFDISEFVGTLFTEFMGRGGYRVEILGINAPVDDRVVVNSDHSIFVKSNIHGVVWEADVDGEYLSHMLSPISFTFVVLVLLSVAVSFFIMKYLIHRNVLNPITMLKRNVISAQDGDLDSCDLCEHASNNEVGQLHDAYVGLVKNIEEISNIDYLSQLPNRTKFHKDIGDYILLQEGDRVSVLFIDLDNFKQVNDSYGHAIGDRLLKQFAQELIGCVEDIGGTSGINVTPYRLGGDEFAVVIECFEGDYKDCCSKCNEGVALCEMVLSLFSGGYEVDGFICDVFPSIGLAQMAHGDDMTPSQLLANADAAMYHVKLNGKNNYYIYDESLAHEIHENAIITHAVNEAIHNDSFYLVYQPIFSVCGDEVLGIECLIRTDEPALDGYGPDKYIPIAELTGAIKKIDDWVMENAMMTLKRLIDDHGYKHTISINISRVELMDWRFVQRVESAIKRSGVPAEQVKLEVTETAFVSGEQKPLAIMNALKEMGVKLSLDDFGTGYTAFSQLMKYNVDEIKIDKCFVDEILGTSGDNKLAVEIIADLGKIYELPVTAEGVETTEQVEFLEHINCHKIQGYLYSKPLGFDKLVKKLV